MRDAPDAPVMRATLQALLTHAIDYAGLFPPAELELGEALINYGEYVRSPERWMLGPFVLPVGKLESAAATLTPFDVENRLRISALLAKPESAADAAQALTAASDAIRVFNESHGATASVDQLEMPLPADAGAALIADLAEIGAALKLPLFLEAPVDDAEQTIAWLADVRAGESAPPIGFKLRTGGVIASAFPSSVQIARALVASATTRVSVKFTAGLHHPIRGFQASVQTKMHGFLNVLGAGVLACEHGWDVQQTAAMLEDENAESFMFTDEEFSWADYAIFSGQISAHRALITSLGSCSFTEPCDDLRALGLL